MWSVNARAWVSIKISARPQVKLSSIHSSLGDAMPDAVQMVLDMIGTRRQTFARFRESANKNCLDQGEA